MQKILVIQTAFIGDVVLATGLLEKLHSKFPGAAIDVLVRKGNESLFTEHPFLNEVLVWDKKKSKYKNLFATIGKIRKKKYDLVVNVQRFAATGLITVLSKAKQTIGFDKNPFSFLFTHAIRHEITQQGKVLHEVERNHELIASVTDEKAARPKLYPSVKNIDAVAKYKSKPYICIAPASVWFTKQFPANQWVTFIQSLPLDLNVYLLGAPGDSLLCSMIQSGAGNDAVTNLAGKLNFLESAALQKDAEMNYVNDSAPMHFASSVNANVAAVYCSTIPAFGFGPLSDNSHIVEYEEKLACRPCGLHGRKECPLGHFHCARLIRNSHLLRLLPQIFPAPKPLEEIASMTEAIDAIAKHRSEYRVVTKPPATEALIASADKELPFILPEDIKAFYRYSDGLEIDEDMLQVLPLSDVINEWKGGRTERGVCIAENMIYCDSWHLKLKDGYSGYEILNHDIVLTSSFAAFIARILKGSVYEKGGLHDWREEILNAGSNNTPVDPA